MAKEFELNEKQQIAYKIIANFFILKYVNKDFGTSEMSVQLMMLMTGPGGTGKTHVVRAV
jgi:hypothetical protein